MDFEISIGKLSLLVNIGTLVVAVLALWSIKVAKDSIKVSARRDSIKYASDLVKLYLKDFVDASSNTFQYLNNNVAIKEWKFDSSKKIKEFTVEEFRDTHNASEAKEIINEYFEQRKKYKELSRLVLREQNLLEAFSVPFTSGVADEEIAFMSIGVTFCGSVERNWIGYCFVRNGSDSEFSFFHNTIKLYNIWNDRIKKYELENTRINIEKEISNISNNKIRPIGV